MSENPNPLTTPSNPQPMPTPPVAPPKRRAPGAVNRKYLNELELTQELLDAAEQADFAQKLATRDWGGPERTALLAKKEALETVAGLNVGRVATRKMSTAEEELAREHLLRLLFMADAVLHKLTPQAPATQPEIKLKGVTAADLTELAAAVEEYSDANGRQLGAIVDRVRGTQTANELYVELTELRRDLQLAADQAWPYQDAANHPARGAFRIPLDRPAIE